MLIALCILGGLALLLCIPFAAAVCIEDDTTVDICWLFVRVRVYPEKEKPPKPQKAEQQAAEKKEKPPRKKNPLKDMELSELIAMAMNAIATAGELLRAILRNLCVRGLVVQATVAGEDAAETAVAYGRMQAILSGAMGVLQSHLRVINPHIEVHPDFLGEKSRYAIRFCASLTPLVVIGAALRAAAKLLWLVLKSGMVGGTKGSRQSDAEAKDTKEKDASRPANKKECTANE